MPYPWIPPRGKLEKKAVFSPCVGDETTTNYTEPILIKISNYYCGAAFCGPARVCGCFISTVCWSHRRLLQFFRRWTLRLAFYWLFIWNFKEKSINHFLWHTLFVRLYQSIWLFHLTEWWTYSLSLQLSPWRNPRLRHFVGTPLELQGKSISHFLWHSHVFWSRRHLPVVFSAFWGRGGGMPWKRFERMAWRYNNIMGTLSRWKYASDCGKQAFAGRHKHTVFMLLNAEAGVS